MYTVIRLYGAPDLERYLQRAIELLPESAPGMHPERRIIGCSLSDDPILSRHVEQIARGVQRLAPLIRDLVALGGEVDIDVAIEPEDYRKRFISEVGFAAETLRLFGDLGVDLVFTAYGQGPD